MTQTYSRTLALLEYAVASVTAPDEEECGDRHLVKAIPEGALMAVVDGAGHGAEAATVARMAIGILEANAAPDLLSLVRRCHEQLRTTRGAVMSLAFVNGAQSTITWLGVGNIEGVLLRSRSSSPNVCEAMHAKPGILGYRLPPLQAAVLPIGPGDLIVFATDGVRPDFEHDFVAGDQPRAIADRISSGHYRGHDDGLVLVARYQGSEMNGHPLHLGQ